MATSVVERFDGIYGRVYDAAVSRPVAMQVAGRVLGRRTVLGDIPLLVRGAYSAVPDEPMLDAPCGAAGSLVHGAIIDRAGPVIGLDMSCRMLARGRERVRRTRPQFDVELEHGDALAMPFDDASFGSALSVNGLHCMPDPARFVTELARVLRPGGILTITTIVDTESRSSRLVSASLRRGRVIPATPPTLAALEAMLDDAGFARTVVVGGSALVALSCLR
jgi:SAM-dependent methyltransferase